IPTHESEQRRRLSPPAARAAPPALPRPFPQPDPSPQSPSSVTSLCRVLACKVAAPPFVPRRVIGQQRIDQNLGRARLDAKCGMAEPCQFHRNWRLGNLSLCGNVSYLQLVTCTFHQLGLLSLQRCLRIRALASPWIVSSQGALFRLSARLDRPRGVPEGPNWRDALSLDFWSARVIRRTRMDAPLERRLAAEQEGHGMPS